MIYQKLSKRQRLAMLWWQQPKFKDREILICDGSIRSGKTLSMTVGFVLWSMSQFNGQVFGICGKTIESLRRNVIMNMRDWLPYDIRIIEKRSENKLIISDRAGRENTYFLFGGRDESSYALIQGITLAGALLDEVVLMPNRLWNRPWPGALSLAARFGSTVTLRGRSTGFTKKSCSGQRK